MFQRLYLLEEDPVVASDERGLAAGSFEDFMQFLILIGAVLISIATAVASAGAILSLLIHLMAKLR